MSVVVRIHRSDETLRIAVEPIVWRMDRTPHHLLRTPASALSPVHDSVSLRQRHGSIGLAAGPAAALSLAPTTYARRLLYICRVQLKFRIRFLVVSTEYGRLNRPLHESTSSTRLSTPVVRSVWNCNLHVPRSCFFGSSYEACCEGQRFTGSSPRTEPRRRRGRLGGNSTELASVCLPRETALILHA